MDRTSVPIQAQRHLVLAGTRTPRDIGVCLLRSLRPRGTRRIELASAEPRWCWPHVSTLLCNSNVTRIATRRQRPYHRFRRRLTLRARPCTAAVLMYSLNLHPSPLPDGDL